MSDRTDATVECPLCGAVFDPSVSGGWCTEPECGTRHVAAAASAGRRLVADGGQTGDAHADDRDNEEESAGRNDRGNDDEDEPIACPACETEIAASDNFCRACGVDVSGIDASGELTCCPSCEKAIEPEDRFCRECGEHLDPHRPGIDGAPATGADERRPRGAPTGAGTSGRAGERSADTEGTDGSSAVKAETVKLGDSGANAADGTDADEPDDEGPHLSLVARNRELTVGGGDTVGKEVRSIIMDTGGEEEDAVRVHREHVRFEYEDGEFYLVDLGQNSTVVNGEELEQGDRVPVEPGDRIDLAGVARIGVRQA